MYSNGLITAPVSVWDVRRALGLNSTDVGTLCTSTRINIWAKYKPVHLLNTLNTADQFDFTQNKWKSSATWMHGSPLAGYAVHRYGLAAHQYTAIADLIAQYTTRNSIMNGWVYNSPTGGASSPYRLIDFANYKHQTDGFAEDFFCGAVRTNPGNPSDISTKVTASYRYSVETDYTITPQNLLGDDYYFGIVMVKDSDMFYFTGSGKTTLSVTLPLNTGTYTVYPFFANKQITYGQSMENTILYTIPLLSPTTVKVTSDYNGGLSVDAKYAQTPDLTTGEQRDDPSSIFVNVINTTSEQREVYFELNYGSTYTRVPSTGTHIISGNTTWQPAMLHSIDYVPYYGSVTVTVYWKSGSTFYSFTQPIKQGASPQ